MRLIVDYAPPGTNPMELPREAKRRGGGALGEFWQKNGLIIVGVLLFIFLPRIINRDKKQEQAPPVAAIVATPTPEFCEYLGIVIPDGKMVNVGGHSLAHCAAGAVTVISITPTP